MNYENALQCIKGTQHFDRHRGECKECKFGPGEEVDICGKFIVDTDHYNEALREAMKEFGSRGLISKPWELSECANSLQCNIKGRKISLSLRWVGDGFDWLWWITDPAQRKEKRVIETGMTNSGPDPIELLPHAMKLAEVLAEDKRMYNCPHRKDDVCHDDECVFCRWRVCEQEAEGHHEDCSWLRLAYTRPTCKFDDVTGDHLS